MSKIFQSNKDIFNMLYFGIFSILAQPDRDGVEMIRIIPKIIHFYVRIGDFTELMKLAAGDIFFWKGFAIFLQISGFDFHKNYFLIFLCDNIYLSNLSPFVIFEVFTDYFISLFFEKFSCQFFSFGSGFSIFFLFPKNHMFKKVFFAEGEPAFGWQLKNPISGIFSRILTNIEQ